MDLLEYQGKQLFRKHGVPVPDGAHADSVRDAVDAAEELGFPVVIKAQVQIGGRGKAGGIKLANDADEAERHAEAILGMDIRGFTVYELYVEKASSIARSTTPRSCSTGPRRSRWRCCREWAGWTSRRSPSATPRRCGCCTSIR
jgi:hypothetical protein